MNQTESEGNHFHWLNKGYPFDLSISNSQHFYVVQRHYGYSYVYILPRNHVHSLDFFLE